MWWGGRNAAHELGHLVLHRHLTPVDQTRLHQACQTPSQLVQRNATRYTTEMIISFQHKGLEILYHNGSTRGIQAAHAPKLLRILAALDAAASPRELNHPGYKLHPLKGDLEGFWSIWVNGNWRVTFRFVASDVELVGYQDYH